MAQRIRGEYDDLEQAARSLQEYQQEIDNLLQQVSQCVQGLENGGWIGEGAQGFYDEMHQLVLPGLERLFNAIADTSQGLSQIIGRLSECGGGCRTALSERQQ